MIGLLLEEQLFEQDIRELLMAFYPGELFCYERQAEVLFYVSGYMNADKTNYHLELTGQGEQFLPEPKDNREVLQNPMTIDLSNHLDTKNKLKRRLYRLLARQTQKQLPWGTLTGIRPVKLVSAMMAAGQPFSEIWEYMKETYLISDEKLQLLIDTAKQEACLLEDFLYQSGYSLYIGIPFCPTTCLYCSFTSYPIDKWSAKTGDYLTTLFHEIEYVAKRMGNRNPDTIYIGGGTPTALSAEDLDRLLNKVTTIFDQRLLREFTVEAGRPDSITREKLLVLRKYGVTRISINPQTMKQETLDLIGRRHTVGMINDCFLMARDLGFNNINMDLIVGLPNETIADVKKTMDAVMELKPDGLTIHSLAIKRAARLNMFKEQYAEVEIANTQEILDLTADYARRMGMQPYYLYRQKNMAGNFENVGYAAPDKACLYNILIMEEKQSILACGAGTSTKVVYPAENRLERAENVKDIQTYIGRIDEMIARKEKLLAKL